MYQKHWTTLDSQQEPNQSNLLKFVLAGIIVQKGLERFFDLFHTKCSIRLEARKLRKTSSLDIENAYLLERYLAHI